MGFEQTFKNSLTTLPIGGAKGGSDFDPKMKSDREIMRFCQRFMEELYRHIGQDIDVPAGDIGVGGREIGFLFGAYRKIRGSYENGVLTGKGLEYGGSLLRPEATGFGAIYYLESVLAHENDSIKGKRVALSGYGNVAWGCAKKLAELSAKAVTISGKDGYVYDPDGIIGDEKLNFLLEMREKTNMGIEDYAKKFGAKFFKGEKPWNIKDVDIIMPCATQNEVGIIEARKIVENGIRYYIEVSNMPTSNEAIKYLIDNKVVVAPSKAVNAGGVAVSALEMSQNSERLFWSADEVDKKLKEIMKGIHDNSATASKKYNLGYNLVAGANIVGFQKVANAMMAQGIAW